MTPAQQLTLDKVRRKKAALDRRAQQNRGRKQAATTSRQGNLTCHACPARFSRMEDWDRHAAATGHDVRRGVRSVTRNAGPADGRVEFAALYR